MLTRNMALEFGPHNIRVSSLSPGVLSTRMTLNSSLGSMDFKNCIQTLFPYEHSWILKALLMQLCFYLVTSLK